MGTEYFFKKAIIFRFRGALIMKREARVITNATKKIRQNKDFIENPFFVLGTHNTTRLRRVRGRNMRRTRFSNAFLYRFFFLFSLFFVKIFILFPRKLASLLPPLLLLRPRGREVFCLLAFSNKKKLLFFMILCSSFHFSF